MRVLGLDPGIRNTGWCVLQVMRPRSRVSVVASGVIRTPKADLDAKRVFLWESLRALEDHAFHVVSVEKQVRWAGLAVAWATCCALPHVMHAQREFSTLTMREVKALLGLPKGCSKEGVRDGVDTSLSWTSPTQHEADAAAQALAALAKMGWLAPRLSGGPTP